MLALLDLCMGSPGRPLLSGPRAGAWLPSRTDFCCLSGAAELRAVAELVSEATACSSAAASAWLGVAVASMDSAAASP